METDLNFNFAECVKSVNNIGSTEYVNICNGAREVVQWGSSDWLGNIALGGVLALIGAVMVGVVIGFIVMVRNY